ncbi:CKLF-like MARVEL transmembrane domain-containing protein 8 [Aethina tumida]|uniref:CKLF-like MARVEL transmembrane domain-containing protein 8 n=1 Tax=Aethina tumida TaxID=116153 RepID=UPI00096B426A|nr:CKLF-like MARVEL transmembrane domain-containing protein 8 [Aethina tumida]XP_019866603.1 CKLF-like MARVEL transmembrane domain-containing protein 8 [Aethina tumida]
MSHTVTVTRTTTTTTTSAIILNTGYLKSWPGLLKLAQLVLGIVVVGLVGYYYRKYGAIPEVPETFFLLMAVTFLIGTFLLLLSCIISISTASIISKTIHEVVYHGFAFVLYLAASLAFVIEVNHYKSRSYYNDYEPYMAAAIIGLVISGLYLLSTIFALRSYRGL